MRLVAAEAKQRFVQETVQAFRERQSGAASAAATAAVDPWAPATIAQQQYQYEYQQNQEYQHQQAPPLTPPPPPVQRMRATSAMASTLPDDGALQEMLATSPEIIRSLSLLSCFSMPAEADEPGNLEGMTASRNWTRMTSRMEAASEHQRQYDQRHYHPQRQRQRQDEQQGVGEERESDEEYVEDECQEWMEVLRGMPQQQEDRIAEMEPSRVTDDPLPDLFPLQGLVRDSDEIMGAPPTR